MSLIDCDDAVEQAIRSGGAGKLLASLPSGLQTKLDFAGGYDNMGSHDLLGSDSRDPARRSLSGGEVGPISPSVRSP